MLEKLRYIFLSHSSFNGPGGFHIDGPVIFVLPATLALVFILIASIIWTYKDAKKRDKNGFIALLFIFLTGWPASFIWWFWLRPPLKGEKRHV